MASPNLVLTVRTVLDHPDFLDLKSALLCRTLTTKSGHCTATLRIQNVMVRMTAERVNKLPSITKLALKTL